MSVLEDNGKLIAAALCAGAAIPVGTTVYTVATSEGWRADSYVTQAAQPARGWQEVNGDQYYFDTESGAVDTATTNEKTAAVADAGQFAQDAAAAIQSAAASTQPAAEEAPAAEETDQAPAAEEAAPVETQTLPEETVVAAVVEEQPAVDTFTADSNSTTFTAGEDTSTLPEDYEDPIAGQPVADVTVDEPAVVDINDETYVEPVVEKQPAEEVPVEEAVSEEVPVEEAVSEEVPAEPVVEDIPVEEAPVVDETYVEEAPVEQAPVVDETYVEDVPVEAAPEETPVQPDWQPEYEDVVYDEPAMEDTVVDDIYVEDTSNPYADLNANIAQAAKDLVGVTNGMQCTEVVQLALANAGVSDAMNLWPNEYAAQYGYYTDDPQPGNLIYYDNGGNGVDHIAIYVGDGQAVHGNYWIGDQSYTVIENVDYPGCGDYAYIQVCR